MIDLLEYVITFLRGGDISHSHSGVVLCEYDPDAEVTEQELVDIGNHLSSTFHRKGDTNVRMRWVLMEEEE